MFFKDKKYIYSYKNTERSIIYALLKIICRMIFPCCLRLGSEGKATSPEFSKANKRLELTLEYCIFQYHFTP